MAITLDFLIDTEMVGHMSFPFQFFEKDWQIFNLAFFFILLNNRFKSSKKKSSKWTVVDPDPCDLVNMSIPIQIHQIQWGNWMCLRMLCSNVK